MSFRVLVPLDNPPVLQPKEAAAKRRFERHHYQRWQRNRDTSLRSRQHSAAQLRGLLLTLKLLRVKIHLHQVQKGRERKKTYDHFRRLTLIEKQRRKQFSAEIRRDSIAKKQEERLAKHLLKVEQIGFDTLDELPCKGTQTRKNRRCYERTSVQTQNPVVITYDTESGRYENDRWKLFVQRADSRGSKRRYWTTAYIEQRHNWAKQRRELYLKLKTDKEGKRMRRVLLRLIRIRYDEMLRRRMILEQSATMQRNASIRRAARRVLTAAIQNKKEFRSERRQRFLQQGIEEDQKAALAGIRSIFRHYLAEKRREAVLCERTLFARRVNQRVRETNLKRSLDRITTTIPSRE